MWSKFVLPPSFDHPSLEKIDFTNSAITIVFGDRWADKNFDPNNL
jgi:hypothetical protein